jgi:nitric oxide reductase large subunit
VVDPAGETIFTRDDVMDGQEVFLRNGLMEYGSIFGHGAYLGPDDARGGDPLHRGHRARRAGRHMSGLDAEVVLAAVYGGGLIAAAVVLDLLARHSHARADRYRTVGFRFHAHLDAWEYPEGRAPASA